MVNSDMRLGQRTGQVEHAANRVTGMGEGVTIQMDEEDIMDQKMPQGMDRAIKQFSDGSLRNHTNQMGTAGKTFQVMPGIKAISSEFAYQEALVRSKHPVQDFWVYDGAYPGLKDRGSIATTREQILPDKRIKEQDAIEWNRVGSKKGWMFEGPPQQNAPGHSGENVPTHTQDGFISRIRDTKWSPVPRSTDKQGLATRDMPAIDIENNARGIGVTGQGSGNGGMSGGYRDVNPERLAALPIPMAKYNWTGTRLFSTGREDQGGGTLGNGAGGYRSGYASVYATQPSFPIRRTTGISRVTQNAA